MMLVEINPHSWCKEHIEEVENKHGLRDNLDMLDEIRELDHVREFPLKSEQRGDTIQR